MSNPGCRQAERLLSERAAGQLSEGEALQAHLAQCLSCAMWAEQQQALVRHIKARPAALSADKLAAMTNTFLTMPTPTKNAFSRPRVLGLVALAASVALLVWVAPLFSREELAASPVVELGPHQGLVQEKAGARVELVVGEKGEVRVYLSSPAGVPHRATGAVKMQASSPAFATTEVSLIPAEGGTFLVGQLPYAGVVEVKLVFPSGTEFNFVNVLLTGTSELVQVALPVEVAGGVAVLEKNRIEAEVLPKGEVRVRVVAGDLSELPSSEFSVPEIVVEHKNKKYPVKLKAKEGHWSGYITAPVEISAGAQVVFVCSAPLAIRGLVYEPTRVVFAPYTIKVSIKIAAPVIIKYTYPGKHKHKHSGKGSDKGSDRD